jgi:Carboxypeptidase regulatory-like domain
MKRIVALLSTSLAILISGCGGGGSSSPTAVGDVSGIVLDQDGNSVRGALVFYDTAHQTLTNSAGVYVLTGVPADNIDIQAQIKQSGVTYQGENIATVANGQRTKDVNIAVYPVSQLASIQGVVTDRAGNLVTGARIFVRPNVGGTLLTSAVGITDRYGNYSIGSLKSGLSYHIQVNALGYNSDTDDINLNAGESRTINYVLSAATIQNVPAPTNLVATAFTSPLPNRSDLRQGSAIENMKRILNPKRTTKRSRITSVGGQIEVDLAWNEINNSALLGYGIYRGLDANHLKNSDFLRDPQAEFYADIDQALIEQNSYSYGITSLDTLYDGSQGESGLSNIVSVSTLSDFSIISVVASANPTISWGAAAGASTYTVRVFDQYPGIGVSPFATSNPVSSTSTTYSGAPLASGHTYYLIVTGASSDGSAYSISPVSSFTVP